MPKQAKRVRDGMTVTLDRGTGAEAPLWVARTDKGTAFAVAHASGLQARANAWALVELLHGAGWLPVAEPSSDGWPCGEWFRHRTVERKRRQRRGGVR